MDKFMHAPGPWTLKYGTSQFINTGEINAYGVRVADLSMEIRKMNEDTAYANAKLMSLAPELYELLYEAHMHRLNEPYYKTSDTCRRIKSILRRAKTGRVIQK